jgi:hypothetical protein
VAADRGRAQAQLAADLGGGRGTLSEQQVSHAITGTQIRTRRRTRRPLVDERTVDFHYTSVTYLVRHAQTDTQVIHPTPTLPS